MEEILRAIAKIVGASLQELEEERLRKLKKRGGFENGYLLLRTASPHSIPQQAPPDQLISLPPSSTVRTISDPSSVPTKALYKRPDHRNLADSTEELLVVETELNRLGTLEESIDFEIPPNVDAQRFVSSIELSRRGGELRAVVRLRSRKRKGEAEGQMAFDFGHHKMGKLCAPVALCGILG